MSFFYKEAKSEKKMVLGRGGGRWEGGSVSEFILQIIQI